MNLPRPSAGFSPLAREVAPLAQKPTGCRCPPSPPLLRYQWACPRVGESPRTQEPSAVFTPRQSRNSVIAGPSFSGLPWGPPGEWGTDLPCSQIPQTSGSRCLPRVLPGGTAALYLGLICNCTLSLSRHHFSSSSIWNFFSFSNQMATTSFNLLDLNIFV